MTELLTAAQMRAIEAAAIASGEVTGLALMERAGRGVVEAVFEEWPELRAGSFRAVVLCGPGNNGGDGFVVARVLREWGWEVEVFLYGDADRLPPDARVNYERWMGMGEVGTIGQSDEATPFTTFPIGKPHDVVVDALFGIGLSRPLSFHEGLGRLLPAWDLRLDQDCPKVVAIDVPSGLDADSAHDDEKSDGLWAHLTVTFHRKKICHVLRQGAFLCGKLVVKDIGLEARKSDIVQQMHRFHQDRISICHEVVMPGHLGKSDPFGRDSHKFTHGHALILSGGPGHGGAARMAARGALRVGAGLVTLGCAAEAIPENAARLDAVMLRVVEGGEALREVLTDARMNAVCIGPGLGLDLRAAELVRVALGWRGEPRPTVGRGSPRRPTVLDADALTLISRDPALFALLHEGCVLTPHGGEFARLFPDIAAKLEAVAVSGPAYSKVDATRQAAARAGCVVLYKGADTVIASPDGTCAINSATYDRAAPWLATAGSGDVLAGFITGLLARGFAPMQAAETAAWLHVECARSFGPGLIAEDLVEALPKVFRAIGV